MLEFLGELHDEILGYYGKGQVVIVDEGEEWEGSIDLDFVPEHPEFILMQGEKKRGHIKIDHVGQDDEGYHAHFVGTSPLKRT